MLYIRVEIWPFGNRNAARCLGEMRITNDGTGTPELGNYRVQVSHPEETDSKLRWWKTKRIKKHPRALSVYHLVYSALKACGFSDGKP